MTISIQGIPWRARDAVMFDMDGVVTDTGVVHARAWKPLFDDYLVRQSGAGAVGSSR